VQISFFLRKLKAGRLSIAAYTFAFFQAAHNQDILAVGSGWGIRQQTGLSEADLAGLNCCRL
jgi:hypothetical protein